VTMVAAANYIRWDDPSVEHEAPEEAEIIKKIATQFNQIQAAMFDQHRHCFGGTHAKTHGLVKGELVVKEDLPDHLRQSMFKEGGKSYPVVMRYSSEPGDAGLDDRIPQPRGLGMKVFNVEGSKFRQDIDGKDPKTQDIEFNSASILELANAKTTYDIVALRMKYGAQPHILSQQLDKRPDGAIQQKRNHLPNTHIISQTMWSQSAYRYGDYVVKYRVIPNTEAMKKAGEQFVTEESPTNQLRDWLTDFMKNNDAEYLFQVQLLQNIDEQPVEDSKIDWNEEKYPYETVATLKIPSQDSFSHKRRAFWEDHMRLDPWHGLKSLQPLGSINRTRKVVYQASSVFRRKVNARDEVTLEEISQVPD